MDVISPDVMWIDGSCYRINCSNNSIETDNNIYDDGVTYEKSEDNDEFIFTTTPNGRVETSLHIPQFFFGIIIGSKGATKKRIENETKTEIKLPPRGVNGNVIITGPSDTNVSSAARRIKIIVMANRQKQHPNHFLSIPMTGESITSCVKSFKDEILSLDTLPTGIDESIFIRTERLHLTVLVMFLADKEEIATAAKLLEEAKISVTDPIFGNDNFIDVSLTGVSYMNDDPTAVRVLYADVKETDEEKNGRLHDLIKKLNDFFDKSGFMVGSHNGNKLHVTLMNATKRLPKIENGRAKPFDASQILKKYEKHVFGQQRITNILLSQMSNEDTCSYYPTIAEISL